MRQVEIRKLVKKYLHDTATKEETEKLFQWYRSEMNADSNWDLDAFEDEEDLKLFILSKIDASDLIEKQAPVYRKFYYLVSAASLAIFMAIGLYFFNNNNQTYVSPTSVKKVVKQKAIDIQPGTNKAILTLSNGKKIILDDSQNEVVINDGAIKVHKNAKGIIEYTLNRLGKEQNEKTEVQTGYNTIQTPIGGKFQLTLADGSKVWLNSASSLRFPVYFSGDNRTVELKGEAYFEVAKSQNKKFTVRSGNQTVEVLGTHFNINAYSDEPVITTTLIEGAIRVVELNTQKFQILKPGEQSKVHNDIKIQKKDTQADIAWKDGYFYFENSSIETVMRQLGRWYGITARYESVLPQQHFEGAISTNLTLLEVLEILQKSNVHFSLEGKEVVVMP